LHCGRDARSDLRRYQRDAILVPKELYGRLPALDFAKPGSKEHSRDPDAEAELQDGLRKLGQQSDNASEVGPPIGMRNARSERTIHSAHPDGPKMQRGKLERRRSRKSI